MVNIIFSNHLFHSVLWNFVKNTLIYWTSSHIYSVKLICVLLQKYNEISELILEFTLQKYSNILNFFKVKKNKYKKILSKMFNWVYQAHHLEFYYMFVYSIIFFILYFLMKIFYIMKNIIYRFIINTLDFENLFNCG